MYIYIFGEKPRGWQIDAIEYSSPSWPSNPILIPLERKEEFITKLIQEIEENKSVPISILVVPPQSEIYDSDLVFFDEIILENELENDLIIEKAKDIKKCPKRYIARSAAYFAPLNNPQINIPDKIKKHFEICNDCFEEFAKVLDWKQFRSTRESLN